MPRTVDPEVRRRRIGAAVLRLLQEHGVEGVSVRTVAAEAGCSAGAVQASFRTRREMLDYALDRSGEALLERLAGLDLTGPPAEVCRRYLHAYLPLDAERRAHALVWQAFAAHAARDPATAETCRAVDLEVRAFLATITGTVDSADLLLAVVDGITQRILYGTDPAPLLATLDTVLDHTFQERAA